MKMKNRRPYTGIMWYRYFVSEWMAGWVRDNFDDEVVRSYGGSVVEALATLAMKDLFVTGGQSRYLNRGIG